MREEDAQIKRQAANLTHLGQEVLSAAQQAHIRIIYGHIDSIDINKRVNIICNTYIYVLPQDSSLLGILFMFKIFTRYFHPPGARKQCGRASKAQASKRRSREGGARPGRDQGMVIMSVVVVVSVVGVVVSLLITHILVVMAVVVMAAFNS